MESFEGIEFLFRPRKKLNGIQSFAQEVGFRLGDLECVTGGQPPEEFGIPHKDIREVLGLCKQFQNDLPKNRVLLKIRKQGRRKSGRKKSVEVIRSTNWIRRLREIAPKGLKERIRFNSRGDDEGLERFELLR